MWWVWLWVHCVHWDWEKTTDSFHMFNTEGRGVSVFKNQWGCRIWSPDVLIVQGIYIYSFNYLTYSLNCTNLNTKQQAVKVDKFSSEHGSTSPSSRNFHCSHERNILWTASTVASLYYRSLFLTIVVYPRWLRTKGFYSVKQARLSLKYLTI